MELDAAKARKWIDTEPDLIIKAIKEKIIANVHYVSASEFRASLIEATVMAFGQLKGEYAVIWDYKPNSSKRWVYHQIKSILHRYQKPAYAGYYTQSVDNILGVGMKLEQKGVQNIVVFDDAAYTGMQLMSRIIEPLSKYYTSKRRPIHFFIVVPYATSDALEKFASFRESNHADLGVFYVHIMKTLLDILSKPEFEYLRKSNREELSVYKGATLTYFDHRVADSFSFFEEVAKLMNKTPKPYAKGDSAYSREEEAEWQLYWQKYLDILKKED